MGRLWKKLLVGSEEVRRWAKSAMRAADRHCIYCGDWFECRDHYIPVSWAGEERTYLPGDVVPSCWECNALLGPKPIFAIHLRAESLIPSYERRSKRWFKIPSWSEPELKQIGYGLQMQIRRALMLRAIYIAKLSNLNLRAFGYEVVPIPLLDEWNATSAASMRRFWPGRTAEPNQNALETILTHPK